MSQNSMLNDTGNQVYISIHDLGSGDQRGEMIRELVGSIDEKASKETLEGVLNPERFWLRMVTVNDKAKLIGRDDFLLPTIDFEPQDMSRDSTELPAYCPSHIEIPETIRSQRAYKVMIEGK